MMCPRKKKIKYKKKKKHNKKKTQLYKKKLQKIKNYNNLEIIVMAARSPSATSPFLSSLGRRPRAPFFYYCFYFLLLPPPSPPSNAVKLGGGDGVGPPPTYFPIAPRVALQVSKHKSTSTNAKTSCGCCGCPELPLIAPPVSVVILQTKQNQLSMSRDINEFMTRKTGRLFCFPHPFFFVSPFLPLYSFPYPSMS
jgi:hypothetical protein